MTEPTADKRDRMLKLVQDLLAKAEHPLTGEAEAATYRAKAESIMVKYRIVEAQLNADAPAPLTVPTLRSFPLFPVGSPYRVSYLDMIGEILYHVGAKGALDFKKDESGAWYTTCEMVGYETDLRYAELLYTAARTYFAARMEPRINRLLSDAENVYNLRSAGVERIKIADMMRWGRTGSATAKVTRLYKAECERRGEDPKLTGRSVSVKTYREAFAFQFPQTLSSRLYAARNAAAQDYSAGAIVLAGRSDRVEEEFYRRFPQLRPTPASSNGKAPKGHKWTAADQKRWERLNTTASGAMGAAAGRKAAEAVDIASSAAKRLEE